MATKRKKKSKGLCAGCGTGIARKRQLCRTCTAALAGMGHGVAAAKSVAPVFLAKSAGSNVVPIGQPAIVKMAGAPSRPKCRRGCGKSKAGADCCTTCGNLLPGRRVASGVVKSSMDSGDYWTRAMMRSADPGERELIRATRLQPVFTGKSAGVSYLPAAAERELTERFYRESDPAARQEIWAQLHPESRGGGAA